MAKWLENAIFYEIYPQSFNDTNGDGIGDFQGIIEKLDYIKETGFNAIWMNGSKSRCSPKATSIPTDTSGQAIYGNNRKALTV